jgi:hypothetical protein
VRGGSLPGVYWADSSATGRRGRNLKSCGLCVFIDPLLSPTGIANCRCRISHAICFLDSNNHVYYSVQYRTK